MTLTKVVEGHQGLIIIGLLVVILVIVIIGLVVVTATKKEFDIDLSILQEYIDSGGDSDTKPAEEKCKVDDDCDARAQCGSPPKDGCCAKCGQDGKCAAGAVTEKGCTIIVSNQGQPQEKKSARQYGSSGGSGGDRGRDSIHSEDSCSSSEDAYLRACFDKGDYSDRCCGVCVNGVAYPGVIGKDGVCQTTVQQTGYAGMGQQPPNTYMFASKGPRVGVAMGSCGNVEGLPSNWTTATAGDF